MAVFYHLRVTKTYPKLTGYWLHFHDDSSKIYLKQHIYVYFYIFMLVFFDRKEIDFLITKIKCEEGKKGMEDCKTGGKEKKKGGREGKE